MTIDILGRVFATKLHNNTNILRRQHPGAPSATNGPTLPRVANTRAPARPPLTQPRPVDYWGDE
jgi:hypothetical protein